MKLWKRPETALFLAAALSLLFFADCASAGKIRHTVAVSVVSATEVLKVTQETEALLVCNRPSAPAAPLCIELEKHHEISLLIAKAATLDGDIIRLTRAVQVGQPLPEQVPALLAELSRLVMDILALIPESPQKASLTSRIEGR